MHLFYFVWNLLLPTKYNDDNTKKINNSNTK